jgi:hypothetical protein
MQTDRLETRVNSKILVLHTNLKDLTSFPNVDMSRTGWVEPFVMGNAFAAPEESVSSARTNGISTNSLTRIQVGAYGPFPVINATPWKISRAAKSMFAVRSTIAATPAPDSVLNVNLLLPIESERVPAWSIMRQRFKISVEGRALTAAIVVVSRASVKHSRSKAEVYLRSDGS